MPIRKGDGRWGIKYAGNPLPIPVRPLYGSYPMVMWCHGGNGCGLAFVRYTDMASEPPAVRTCHACQDSPDEMNDGSDGSAAATNNIRLFCGGPPKGRKVRHHVFHISCWIRSIQGDGGDPDRLLQKHLLVKPKDVKLRKLKPAANRVGLSWEDLSPEERQLVSEEFRKLGVEG